MQLLLQVGHLKFPKSRGDYRAGLQGAGCCASLGSLATAQAWGTPVGLQELCSCLGSPSQQNPSLQNPTGQGKLPTAAPVWEWVSNKPGSSRVMLCANSSEVLSRILFCWLCLFPPDPATAALLPSGLLQERLLTWLMEQSRSQQCQRAGNESLH